MKKEITCLLVLLGVFAVMTGCAKAPQRSVCFKQGCFEIELAQTPQEWQKGLSNRMSLGEDKGMLFIFPVVDRYNFWMKDTFIPLDIIWITESGYILHIEKNVPPCKADPCPSYGPSDVSRFVLEINSGLADQMGLAPGDMVQFRF